MVNGRTSTAVEIAVVKIGRELPDTYSAPNMAVTEGFDWYVSEHYALKSNLGDAWARHVLEISELALPHWIAATGLNPPDPSRRMAIIYASDVDALNRCVETDLHARWTPNGGGVTLYGNRAAYNYPSGTLRYHRRALVIHENLHMLQLIGAGTGGTEGLTYAGEQHVYDEQRKRLTVFVMDHPTINNWIDAGFETLRRSPLSFREAVETLWNRGGGTGAVYTQFFLTDPDRSLRWRLWRDAHYAGRVDREGNLRVMEDVFGPLEALEDDWEAWLTRRSSFHFVDWGWEQCGDTLWSYGWPWNPERYSQTDLRYAPGEPALFDPLRMDSPADPASPLVGPVKRGVDEPSVGCLVDFSRNPDRGLAGLGLGLVSGADPASTGTPPDPDPPPPAPGFVLVVVRGGRELVIDGARIGMPSMTIPFPEAFADAMDASGHRVGLTLTIRHRTLHVTARTGPAGGMREVMGEIPLTGSQRRRLMKNHMTILAKDGYHGVTPFIDDARRETPDLDLPAAPNRWRFEGYDRLYGIYRAAWRLKERSPPSLVGLKRRMLAAVDGDSEMQAQAVRDYVRSLDGILRDIRRTVDDESLVAAAIAELTGQRPAGTPALSR